MNSKIIAFSLIFVLLLAGGLFAGTHAILSGQKSSHLKTYTSKNNEFSVRYPSDWTVVEDHLNPLKSAVDFLPPAYKHTDANTKTQTLMIGEWNEPDIRQGDSLKDIYDRNAGEEVSDTIVDNDHQTKLATINGYQGYFEHARFTDTLRRDQTDIYRYFIIDGKGRAAYAEYSGSAVIQGNPGSKQVIDNGPYIADFQKIINSIHFLQTTTVSPAAAPSPLTDNAKAEAIVSALPEVQQARKERGDDFVNVIADHKQGNLIVVHVYALVVDHLSTLNWYDVDLATGKATPEF